MRRWPKIRLAAYNAVESRTAFSPFPGPPGRHQRALAIEPDRRSGTIRDVDHVVILMQENRSHYFGTRPARGFADPHPRHARRRRSDAGRRRHPHRPPMPCSPSIAATRRWGHHAAHLGRRPARLGTTAAWTSGYPPRAASAWRLRPAEPPFQTALADAFTLCEAYHCSMQAGTNPNRLFLWTGANDPRGEAGGPALVNTHDRLGPPPRAMPGPPIPNGCSRPAWTGASIRHGRQLQRQPWPAFANTAAHAAGGDALRERALSTRTLQDLARDVAAGSLPQVSWIIAPAADSEHPEVSSPRRRRLHGTGAGHPHAQPGGLEPLRLLRHLRRERLLYDHVPPGHPRATTARDRAACPPWSWTASTTTRAPAPAPARLTTLAALHGRAFGMGPRVPMLVVSPWSRGGWVNAQVFDHTSVIRFRKPAMASWNPTSAPGAAPSPAT